MVAGGWAEETWAPRLLEVLDRAQRLGFLGPGRVGEHVEQANRFRLALEDDPPARALDLGSGAGVPGLVLALWWPDSRWVLLDSMVRRTGPLEDAVAELGLGDRVTVVTARAEEAGHDPALRGSFDAVTARSFGAPAVAAECGAAFLLLGGRLVVSDPPDGAGDRWPASPLARLGLRVTGHPEGCSVLVQHESYPPDRPRRTGVPAKRPLF